MSGEWEPLEFVNPELPDEDNIFMEIDVTLLGSSKAVLRPGDVLKIRARWITQGGIVLRPDGPCWIKLNVTK